MGWFLSLQGEQQEGILQVHEQQMVDLLSDGAGKLLTDDIEKAEVLNAYFASVSTSKTSLQEFQAPETRGEVWNLSGGGPD